MGHEPERPAGPPPAGRAWPRLPLPGRAWLRGRGRWLVLALVAAGVVFWAYRQAAKARDLADPVRARREGRAIPVRTAPVSETEVEVVIGGTAVTAPSEVATLRAGPDRSKQSDPVAETVVDSVLAGDGEFVRKGQVVIQLRDALAADIVKQREAALAAAVAEQARVRLAVEIGRKHRDLEVASSEAEVKFRADDLESRRALYDTTARAGVGAYSDRDLYDARSRYSEAVFRKTEADRRLQKAKDALVAGVAADQAELTRVASLTETARIDLDAARAGLDRCKIRSPFDGFLNKVEADPGQTVVAVAPLGQVLRLDPLHVRMDCPLDRIGELAVGQKAEVVLDGLPQEVFEGTVARIAPQANAELRVLPVVIELKNPGGRVKAGLTGFARVRVVRKAATVPSLAVIRRGGKAVAFRVEGGRARVRELRLGPVAGPEMLEVRGGLAAGDEVVVFHNFYSDANSLAANGSYLQDNDPVDPDWRKWTRRD